MVYRSPFIKATAQGSLIGTDEIFNFGFHISSFNLTSAEDNYAEVGAQIQPIAEAVAAFFSNANTAVPNKFQLDTFKLALINTDGKYVENVAPFEYIYPTPVPGAASGAYAPQLSAVITLVSSKYKDPGKYNRFYLPTIGTTQAGGVMEEFRPEYLATEAVNMIEAINAITTAISLDLSVSVVSGTGTGSSLAVFNVQVGNVIDTQRRRRNKITETYFNLPIDGQ